MNLQRKDKPVCVTPVSMNGKTGLVSATYAPIQSCPDTCVFKDQGCYGQTGPCGLVFNRVTKNTEKLELSITDIAAHEASGIDCLPGDLPLRLHVTGDCTTNDSAKLVSAACERYAERSKQPVWAYTHAWLTVDRDAWGSVNVLASVENLTQAKQAINKGYTVAFVVPLNKIADTVQECAESGLNAKLCNNFSKKTKCTKCRVCFNTDISEIDVVLLPTHGAQLKKADTACKNSK